MTRPEVQSFTDNDRTATVTEVVIEQRVRTRTIAELVDSAGWLSSQVGLHVQDATQLQDKTNQLHSDTLHEFIRVRADDLATKPLTDLLRSLAGKGFAWRDVARLVGVSVPALRKWRQGEQATGENRLKVAQLLAFCELLEEKALVTDPVSWLEMPLVEEAPVSGLDLLAAHRVDLLFDRALRASDPEAILDEYEPDWRSTYSEAFEVFEADDGMLGLRPREHG